VNSRLVVLISGSGTNLQALLDATADGRLDAKVVLVVSNRKTAFGLARAEQAGVETLYFPLKPYREQGLGREVYDAGLAQRVGVYEPDLVVLAGWMHLLSPAFLDCFPGRVINLHPALPGAFAGTNAIERAYSAFRQGILSHSGCMVHHVVPEVDAGPVVAQTIVPIEAGDSLADFETRMHQAEHELIVAATRRALREAT
jgi:formyltetrahydrofolate-dependent phosphoribosylglycinamide formyltransferase